MHNATKATLTLGATIVAAGACLALVASATAPAYGAALTLLAGGLAICLVPPVCATGARLAAWYGAAPARKRASRHARQQAKRKAAWQALRR